MPEHGDKRGRAASPRGRRGGGRAASPKSAQQPAGAAYPTPAGEYHPPAPPSCGGAAPDTPFDHEYFAALTSGDLVEVIQVPGKGKGVRVTCDVDTEDTVLEEHAFVLVPNLADRRTMVPACPESFLSLETPREVWRRIMCPDGVGPAEPDMPLVEQFRTPTAVPCPHAEKGCPLRFASRAYRDRADQGWHAILCRGRMPPGQCAALHEFEHTEWTCGGVDYCDSVHVLLHAVAVELAALRLRGESVDDARRPFLLFAWTPWTELATQWATDPHATPPEEMLRKLVAALRAVFLPSGEAEEALFDQAWLNRQFGLTLLNAQERSPESPWGRYLTWLEPQEPNCPLIRGEYDWRASRPTDASNKLYYSASGQGLFRAHASINHSCDPSCEVRYTDKMDETLLICALRPLKKGDEVTISYIDNVPGVPRKRRQKYLQTNYRFDCLCERCEREK